MSQIQVVVDTGAGAGEVERIRSVLNEAGFDADIEAGAPPQADSIWLVLLGLPVTAFLTSFFAEAGKDGWKQLKRFVEDLKAARGPGAFLPDGEHGGFGQVVIRAGIITSEEIQAHERDKLLPGFARPGDASPELLLSHDLPDEAYVALHELDPDHYPNQYIYWDPEGHRWRGAPKS